MTAALKITLKELDQFYRDTHSDIELDDYMRMREIVWSDLSYERKLAIYNAFGDVKSGQQTTKRTAASKESTVSPARQYHALPGVAHYFRTNKLNHESGDYREGPTTCAYRFWRAWYAVTGRSGSIQEHLHLCRYNNLHPIVPDDDL
ncbi:hypothetical protein [Phenylobacterium sp.]|uniref:hypothetical protein n=1 Tax=Phenylobacterium sp. TaxID=1871053 RepID=UPI00301DE776